MQIISDVIASLIISNLSRSRTSTLTLRGVGVTQLFRFDVWRHVYHCGNIGNIMTQLVLCAPEKRKQYQKYWFCSLLNHMHAISTETEQYFLASQRNEWVEERCSKCRIHTRTFLASCTLYNNDCNNKNNNNSHEMFM